MARAVRLDGFTQAVEQILQEYAGNVTEGTKAAVKKVAEQAKKETQAASPRRTGRYKRGWAVKEEVQRLSSEAIVHNRTSYQLTHLLEKGHALKRGGRTIGHVRAFPHIGPAEERAIRNLEEAVERIAAQG